MYLGDLGLIVAPNQGGQGAVALVKNTPKPIISTANPSAWLTRPPQATPVKPVDLVPVLPSISTKRGPVGGGCLNASATGSGQDSEPQTPLSCRVGSWAMDNKLLAGLLVVGTFLIFNRE